MICEMIILRQQANDRSGAFNSWLLEVPWNVISILIHKSSAAPMSNLRT